MGPKKSKSFLKTSFERNFDFVLMNKQDFWRLMGFQAFQFVYSFFLVFLMIAKQWRAYSSLLLDIAI